MPTTAPGATRRAASIVSVPGPQPTSSSDMPGASRSRSDGMAIGERARGHDPEGLGGNGGSGIGCSHHAGSAISVSDASTEIRASGPITAVDSRSSTMAGPAKVAPARSA